MPTPNSVFMIGWEYPPHNSGGLGVACDGLTRAMAAAQHNLTFSLPYHFPDKIDHMDLVQCTHPNWAKRSDRQSNKPPFSAYSPLDHPQPTVLERTFDRHEMGTLPQSELEQQVDEYAKVVAQAGNAKREAYEIIHAHDWMAFPAAMALQKKTKKPFVAHVHSTEFDRIPHGTGSPYIKQTEYEGMQAAQRVIAVSYYTKRLLVQQYGINPAKIDVVHNGVQPLLYEPDPGAHHFAHKRPVVAFMGRLTMQKGAEYFLQLARAVLRERPDTLFVVAGNGDMYQELLFRTAADGLSASVLFSGFVRDVQREKLLNRADVFVMPSLSEPFGLVAVEAAQRHTPVIVSKNAGVSEVLPSALAVDFWDVEKMHQAINALLDDPRYRADIADKQLSDVHTATWDTAAEKIAAVYRRAFTGN